MRKPIQLTVDQIRELFSLRERGMSYRELARHFKVSHQTINRWLSRLPHLTQGERVKLTQDVQSGIFRLAEGDIVYISGVDDEKPDTSILVKDGPVPIGICVDVPISALRRI